MSFHIATLCGSLRHASTNRHLLQAAAETAPNSWRFEHLSGLGDIPLYNQDIEDQDGFPAAVTQLADAIRAADGLIISSPEYNYGPPGVLKNAIDWLSRVQDQPFESLPLSLMSASPSPMGGIRAQYPLRQIFVALKADVTPRPEVAVASAHERFDDGRLVHEQTRDVIADHLSAFEAVLKRHA
jgi:chromate reductase